MQYISQIICMYDCVIDLVSFQHIEYSQCPHVDHDELTMVKITQWITSKATPYCKVCPLHYSSLARGL